MNLQLIALILFIVMYAGMIAFTQYRPWIALGAAERIDDAGRHHGHGGAVH